MAIEAKGQVEQWGSDAGDAIARATNVVVPADRNRPALER
jgi:hypothetical protein